MGRLSTRGKFGVLSSDGVRDTAGYGHTQHSTPQNYHLYLSSLLSTAHYSRPLHTADLLHHTTRATIGSLAFLGLLGSSIGTIRTAVEVSSQRLTCRRLTWLPRVGRDGGVAGDGRPSPALACLPLGFCLVKFPRQTAQCHSATAPHCWPLP